MDKEMWYMYTTEYYLAIKRNAFESLLMRWMNQEPIIQSEVSQKEKDKYSILTKIYLELRKTIPVILQVGQQRKHRCKEQTFGLSKRRQG